MATVDQTRSRQRTPAAVNACSNVVCISRLEKLLSIWFVQFKGGDQPEAASG